VYILQAIANTNEKKKIVGLRAIKTHIKSKFENNYGFLISQKHTDMKQKHTSIELEAVSIFLPAIPLSKSPAGSNFIGLKQLPI